MQYIKKLIFSLSIPEQEFWSCRFLLSRGLKLLLGHPVVQLYYFSLWVHLILSNFYTCDIPDSFIVLPNSFKRSIKGFLIDTISFKYGNCLPNEAVKAHYAAGPLALKFSLKTIYILIED